MSPGAVEQPAGERRVPVSLPVRVQLLAAGGAVVDAAVQEGATRDVSRSGACVVVRDISAAVQKAIAEERVGGAAVDVPVGRRRLRLSGKVTWVRVLPRGGGVDGLLGVEYDGAAAGHGEAVLRYAEQRYHRPRVVRAVVMVVLLAAAGGVGLYGWQQQRRAEAISEVDRQLADAARLRLASAGRVEQLEAELQALRASADAKGEEVASRQQQLASLQVELETFRRRVGELAVSRADLERGAPASGGARRALEHFDRGQQFSRDNNLAAALIEYQRAVELAPDLAEAHLEIAVISDLYGRSAEAIASYKTYLGLRPGALDAYEIRAAVQELEVEQGRRTP